MVDGGAERGTALAGRNGVNDPHIVDGPLGIAAPLSDVDEVELLARNGATEFYCGVAPAACVPTAHVVVRGSSPDQHARAPGSRLPHG